MRIKGGLKKVEGSLRVPSDKSISHRAVILGALARGRTFVREWLRSEDTKATLEMVKALGVQVEERETELILEGRDFTFLEPSDVLDAKNSGTTARLMLGVLSTQELFSVVTGDGSLRRRPMGRVTKPLKEMGAFIDGRNEGSNLPVAVRGGKLKGISFFNEKSSAQVKSALLLAGLRAKGVTSVTEKVPSRDHTERMLRAFGVEVKVSQEEAYKVELEGGQTLQGTEVFCPADPSSAAFFCALGVLAPKGEILLRDVLVNPTRIGFYRKLRQMGAEISFEREREISGEPVADILVRPSQELKGVEVTSEEVPSLIDEVPILAVVMAFAQGVSEVRGAKELRVKESDRIGAIVQNLKAMGAEVEEFEDGFRIEGGKPLKGAEIKTFGDHRIAMAFAVAGLLAQGETYIDDPECVAISYPSFFDDLFRLIV